MKRNYEKSLWVTFLTLALQSYDFVVFLFLVRGVKWIYESQKIQGWDLLLDIMIGLFARPLGALLLGSLADKYGRKKLLIITTFFMGIITFGFAFLPVASQEDLSYLSWFLIVLRGLQGAIFGSDAIIANTYLYELAPEKKKNFFASFSQAGQELGTCLAILVSIGFLVNPNSNFIMNYGWRIPFISALLSMMLGMHLRYSLLESPEYHKRLTHTPILKILFGSYKRQIFKILAVVPIVGVSFYLFRVFILNQSEILMQLSVAEILILSLISCLGAIGSSLLGGYLSDLVGLKPVMISSALGVFLLSWPTLVLIYHPGDEEMVFIRMLVAQLIMSLFSGLYAGALAGYIARLFPAKIRATGSSVAYNFAISVISGSFPVFSVYYLVSKNVVNLAGTYLTIWALVALFVIGFSKNHMPHQKEP